MTCRKSFFFFAASLLLCGGLPANALDWNWKVGFDGLFDNREYKDDMLPQTIYGMRAIPEVSLSQGISTLTAGFSLISEFGAREDDPLTDLMLYYSARKDEWSAHFGNFPRTILQRQLPDAFLYDSIAFFEPMISGTLFQYCNEQNSFSTELYCNWTGRQTYRRREAFRIVSDGYYGKNESWFGAGWWAAMTHFAKPKEPGHYIYEKFQFNPYLSASYSSPSTEGLFLEARAGVLFSMVRCRGEEKWHMPMGFLGSIRASFRMFDLSSTFYAGELQQPFLDDGEAGMLFHRSDPFYNHRFYNKTGLVVKLFSDSNVDFLFQWNLHFTPHSPIHNQQLITVRFNSGLLGRTSLSK